MLIQGLKSHDFYMQEITCKIELEPSTTHFKIGNFET